MKRRKCVKGRMTGEELRDDQIRTAKGIMEMYEQDRRQKREGGFEVDPGVYMVKHAADAPLARARQDALHMIAAGGERQS